MRSENRVSQLTLKNLVIQLRRCTKRQHLMSEKKKAYNWLSPLANILEQADGLGETE